MGKGIEVDKVQFAALVEVRNSACRWMEDKERVNKKSVHEDRETVHMIPKKMRSSIDEAIRMAQHTAKLMRDSLQVR